MTATLDKLTPGMAIPFGGEPCGHGVRGAGGRLPAGRPAGGGAGERRLAARARRRPGHRRRGRGPRPWRLPADGPGIRRADQQVLQAVRRPARRRPLLGPDRAGQRAGRRQGQGRRTLHHAARGQRTDAAWHGHGPARLGRGARRTRADPRTGAARRLVGGAADRAPGRGRLRVRGAGPMCSPTPAACCARAIPSCSASARTRSAPPRPSSSTPWPRPSWPPACPRARRSGRQSRALGRLGDVLRPAPGPGGGARLRGRRGAAGRGGRARPGRR